MTKNNVIIQVEHCRQLAGSLISPKYINLKLIGRPHYLLKSVPTKNMTKLVYSSAGVGELFLDFLESLGIVQVRETFLRR